MKTIIDRIRLAVLVTAVGTVGFLPIRLSAGPSPDQMSSALRSREQAAKVPKGEAVAMVCSKCHTVQLSTLNTKRGFLGWFQPKAKHECPGCGGAFQVKDVYAGQGGRWLVSEYVHTCTKCGDNSAFCCTTTSGAGPTKGMEK